MIAHLSRRYLFSASHRLHSEEMSESENESTYGKCNNPYGHGHNYTLDVTIKGQPDPTTGMIMNLVDLKATVNEILEEFDHKHLNEDTPYFKALIPTSETVNAGLNAYDLPAAASATTASTAGNIAVVEGLIEADADGDVLARFASEVSGAAITAKAGSIVQWYRVS